jgi:simple sugar transport system permease protein
VAVAALLLAAIAMAGDSLQINSGLPAASVNVLMAVVLLVVLGSNLKRRGAPKNGVTA